MTLRIVEIVLGADAANFFQEPLGDVRIHGVWRTNLDDGARLIRILVDSDQAEKLMDFCAERFGELPEFRCVVLAVEAMLPRLDPESEEQPVSGPPEEEVLKPSRISREELYADIEGPASLTGATIALTALATLVAAMGLIRDDTAVVIGAMVIAPLLGPNMALSLATLLVDASLARKAVKSIVVGVLEALVLAFLVGLVLDVNADAAEMVSRTDVGIGDVGLALCAGAAGALSFTSGVSSALVGVMAAVALLPPLAVCGLMLALGRFELAVGAGLLFLVNLVCINLSGVIVFRLQGIRPGDKDQAYSAVWSTMLALAFWTALLTLLVWVIVRRGAFLI